MSSTEDASAAGVRRLSDKAAQHVKAAIEAAYLATADMDEAERTVAALVPVMRVELEADLEAVMAEIRVLAADPATPPLSDEFKNQVLQAIAMHKRKQ